MTILVHNVFLIWCHVHNSMLILSIFKFKKQHVNLLIWTWIFVHFAMGLDSYTNRYLCKNSGLSMLKHGVMSHPVMWPQFIIQFQIIEKEIVLKIAFSINLPLLMILYSIYLHFQCESLNEPLHLRCGSYLHEQIDFSHTHIRAIWAG